MDVLSEVLKSVRLEGALFFNAEFSAPWCVSNSRASEMAPYLAPGARHSIVYHFLTQGHAYVKLARGHPQDLRSGDIIVFPHGDAHILGSGSPAKPVEALTAFSKNISQGLKVTRFGGGGEVTKFVCGFLACQPRLSEVFLVGLPPMLKVHVGKEPAGHWLEDSIRLSAGETDGGNAGSGLILAKLSELLFIETLRRYINALPAEQTGWLAGARDVVVGQALAYLHKDPSQPWTISNLARRVGQSRTRFTERFHHFIGESPMSYLARWRLNLGAEILQSTDQSVAEVAGAVGYASEASFNRAFRRIFDCPPAQFRRKSRVTRASDSNRNTKSGSAVSDSSRHETRGQRR